MKVISETHRAHEIWYIRGFFYPKARPSGHETFDNDSCTRTPKIVQSEQIICFMQCYDWLIIVFRIRVQTRARNFMTVKLDILRVYLW